MDDLLSYYKGKVVAMYNISPHSNRAQFTGRIGIIVGVKTNIYFTKFFTILIGTEILGSWFEHEFIEISCNG